MPVTQQTIFNSYTANGVTTAFAYTFRIIDSDQLKVYVDAVLQGAGYTVSGVGDQAGGTVTFAVPPANGLVVRIVRITDIIREYDYEEAGGLGAETLDNDQDYQTMMIQELSQGNLREDPATGQWDAAGKRITNLGFPEVYTDAATALYVDELVADVTYAQGRGEAFTATATGNGSAVTFSVPGAALTNPNAYVVTLNGVLVSPNDYVINATADTITFTTPPGNGVAIEVRVFGFARTIAEPGKISVPAYNAPAGVVVLGNTISLTVGAAGPAAALPATPVGYLEFYIGSVKYKLPFYTA